MAGKRQHLDKAHTGYRHDKRHLKYVKGLYPRSERWAAGAALVTIYRDLVKAREQAHKGRHRGWTAISKGGMTREMWVVKKGGSSGLRKGQQVHVRAMVEHAEEQGATFRNIRFPANRDTMDALKRMARAIGSFHHGSQYGFVPQRDCVASAARHQWAKVVFLLDIENAFDQIGVGEVYDILHDVFLVNSEEAWFIARLCTSDTGHLYQGNPMAPALFNIRAMWMAERLSRLASGNGLTFTMYADDLAISSDSWTHVSHGLRKTVARIIGECGLRVNERKCRVCQVSPRKVGHYDITGLTVDFERVDNGCGTTWWPVVRPLHRKRVLSKAQLFEYLRSRGIVLSHELAKNGERKQLVCVQRGLEGWGHRKPDPGDYPQARLPLQ